MLVEAILIAAVLAAGVLWLLPALRGGRRRVALGALALGTGCGVWLALEREPPPAEEQVADRPIQVRGDGYVSSQACRACHPSQYDTWHSSYHRTMTQVPAPENVLGDFDGVELVTDGSLTRLERVGDEFWVERDDPDAPPDAPPRRIRRRVVLLTGSHHLQIPWYATGDGRELGGVGYTWVVADGRWVPRRATFVLPHSHWPRSETGRWNTGCIACHSTHGQPRASEMDTRTVDFGIACESCHGPADEHVRRHQNPRERYELHLEDRADPTIVNPARLSPLLASQVCGQCHSNSTENFTNNRLAREEGQRYRPGDDLRDTRLVIRQRFEPGRLNEFLRSDPAFVRGGWSVEQMYRQLRQAFPLKANYWSDGMIRTSGSEYNGLIETPCYQHGPLSCLSCHTMHQPEDDPRPRADWTDDQLAPGMETNRACLECHGEFGEGTTAHTRHPPGSSGSLCYNCHMPFTTWGILKAMRSHTIDSPSVSASLETGRPNACNQCHLDRTLAWAAEHLEQGWGIEPPELGDDEASVAASLLWLLSGDAGQRALMAWSMGWPDARAASGEAWLAPYLAQLLEDPYDVVRIAAYRSLRSLPSHRDFEWDYLAPEAERASARERALALWSPPELDVAERGSDPRLIGSDGGIRRAELDRLLGGRDDRTVLLAE